MAGRTFAIGDIHGELEPLYDLLSTFPSLDEQDTLIFLGDYLDRGPCSKQLIEFLRHYLPNETPAKLVLLRGNHEDAWLRVIDDGGWPGFVSPAGNGCFATLRSFTGGAHPLADELPTREESRALMRGAFFPEDVVMWLRSLPHFYEDEHAIYLHGGIPRVEGGFPHPAQFEDKTPLLWVRPPEFFREYRGKRVIVGHTCTENLPPDASWFASDESTHLWASEGVIAIDTCCGRGGFLSAIELPALRAYESHAAGVRESVVTPKQEHELFKSALPAPHALRGRARTV